MIAIIQARTGSKRFPKKVLKKINRITLLDHVLERLKYSKKIKRIIVATSTKKADDIIEKISINKKISCYRGSENNVLKRYIDCCKYFKVNDLIRLTADDPFIDPNIIDKLIIKFKKGKYDFVSNTPNKTFPLGLDATVVKYKVLSEILNLTKKKSHLEHVVTYLFENKNKYKYFYFDRNKDRYSQMRWTIDYPSDLLFAKRIYKELHKKNKVFLFKDIVNYLKEIDYKIK